MKPGRSAFLHIKSNIEEHQATLASSDPQLPQVAEVDRSLLSLSAAGELPIVKVGCQY